MRTSFFILLAVLFAGCRNHHQTTLTSHPQLQCVIAILPFGIIDSSLAGAIRSELARKFSARFTILRNSPLPSSAYYPARDRYIADSLLNYLRDVSNDRFEKIIGITGADISTRKAPYNNWGVMGLGNCPGEACVISSFRVKKSAADYTHFIKRMVLLIMHELGHTFSLPHCSGNSCIMRDAEGKMNLDETETYCGKCSETLRGAGILK